jgi:hypothetical protein
MDVSGYLIELAILVNLILIFVFPRMIQDYDVIDIIGLVLTTYGRFKNQWIIPMNLNSSIA